MPFSRLTIVACEEVRVFACVTSVSRKENGSGLARRDAPESLFTADQNYFDPIFSIACRNS
jgi:hypothetical protein